MEQTNYKLRNNRCKNNPNPDQPDLANQIIAEVAYDSLVATINTAPVDVRATLRSYLRKYPSSAALIQGEQHARSLFTIYSGTQSGGAR